jgi:hypothetical protein
MSIYRRTSPARLAEIHDAPVRPATTTPPRQDDWTTRRTSQPATGLLKPTHTWAATLPDDVRPNALMMTFPRIANLMAAMWHDPNSFRRYVDDLLVDRRGNRQGFPLEVLRELFKIRAYYDDVHPDDNMPWERASFER